MEVFVCVVVSLLALAGIRATVSRRKETSLERQWRILREWGEKTYDEINGQKTGVK